MVRVRRSLPKANQSITRDLPEPPGTVIVFTARLRGRSDGRAGGEVAVAIRTVEGSSLVWRRSEPSALRALARPQIEEKEAGRGAAECCR